LEVSSLQFRLIMASVVAEASVKGSCSWIHSSRICSRGSESNNSTGACIFTNRWLFEYTSVSKQGTPVVYSTYIQPQIDLVELRRRGLFSSKHTIHVCLLDSKRQICDGFIKCNKKFKETTHAVGHLGRSELLQYADSAVGWLFFWIAVLMLKLHGQLSTCHIIKSYINAIKILRRTLHDFHDHW